MSRVLVFVLTACLAVLAAGTGCALRHLEWVPTVYVTVVNNCRDSVLVLTHPDTDRQLKIPYTGLVRVPVRTYSHLSGISSSGGSNSKVLTVRGWASDGTYLGSASQSFYAGYQGRAPDQSWEVTSLQGGDGRCR